MTSNLKVVEWILKIAIAGTFFGHGMFGLQRKAGWFKYFEWFGITNSELISTLLLIIGIIDVSLALLVLIKPIRLALLWMALWGLWTAMIRWPFGVEVVWDFIERWANWGAPLALLLLLGWPKNWREWFK